jgi:transcription elongation factor GreA
MVQRVPISKTGYGKLREELDRLNRVERHEVIRAIEVAREHGDLKENAEYHAAKERQGFVEGRMAELKDKLARAEVIDCSNVNCEKVVFGTVVSLVDLDTDEEVKYQLLGPEEADMKHNRISVLSPLGGQCWENLWATILPSRPRAAQDSWKYWRFQNLKTLELFGAVIKIWSRPR